MPSSPVQNSLRPAFQAWPYFLPVLPIAAVAIGLRFWHARTSLWIDELHTSWTVSGEFADVFPRATYGNQTPLYFWLEWIVVQGAAKGELATRAISLLSGLLLLVAIFVLAKRISAQLIQSQREASENNDTLSLENSTIWIGLLAAWLASWDGLLVFYAQEARPYAILQLIVVCQQIAALGWLSHSTRWRLTAALALAAIAVLLHPTALLIFLPQIMYLAYLAWKNGGTFRDDALLSLLVLGSSLFLQWPSLLHAFSHKSDWEAFVDRPTAAELLTLLPGFAWALFPITLFGVEKLRNIPAKKPLPQRSRQAIQLLLPLFLWLVVPVLLCWLMARLDIARLWMPRYVAGSIPAISLLLAVMVSLLPSRSSSILAGVALAIAVPLSSAASPARQLLAGDYQSDHQEDWRGAIARLKAIRTEALATAPLFIDSGLIETQVLTSGKTTAQDQEYGILPVRGLYDPGLRAATYPVPYGAAAHLPESTWRKVKDTRQLLLLTRASPSKGAETVSQLVIPWKKAGRSVKIYRHYASPGVQLYRVELTSLPSKK